MIETSSASIDEFISASKTRKNPTGKQRHVVDAFRTVFWFHLLRINSGAKSTYQMDQLLEKHQSQSEERAPDCKNKWRSYRNGRHTPSPALVQFIAASYPDSHAVLNHVLWEVLRLDRPVSRNADFWLSQLHPEVRTTIYRYGTTFSVGKSFPRALNQTRLSMLERRAGLDALACLIILLRKTVEAGDSSLGQKLGRSLCRMLLILGHVLSRTGLSKPLVQYIEQEILPLTSCDGLQYGFGEDGYDSTAERLTFVANWIEGDENRRFTISECIALRIDILDGRRGDILHHTVITKPTTTESAEAERNMSRQIRSKTDIQLS